MIHVIASPLYDQRGQIEFHHLSAPPASLDDPGQRSGSTDMHARGLLVVDKHHPLRASGSGSLRRLTRRDVAVRTHPHMIVCTRV
jgi:hypothetical protein